MLHSNPAQGLVGEPPDSFQFSGNKQASIDSYFQILDFIRTR